MNTYAFAINPNEKSKEDTKDHYGSLASYNIDANSPEDARSLGIKRFFQEHPDRSHNPDDYTTDVGILKEN